jgi:hypothetical protein
MGRGKVTDSEEYSIYSLLFQYVNDVTYFRSYVIGAGLIKLTFVLCENSFTTNNDKMKNNEEMLNKVRDNNKNEVNVKKNEDLQNDIHRAINPKPFMIIRERSVGKYMKIFSYMVLLVGIAIVFNSCIGGYVASEPSYVQYDRPQRPSETHIWIDGDWNWNNQTHVYVQKAGYWDRPRQGQSYVAGSWQSTSRGKTWSKGHWQKDGHQGNNSNNNRQKNNRDNR